MITYLRSLFWSVYLRLRGAKVGSGLRVCGPLKILLRDGGSYRNITIGDNVAFGGKVYIRIRRKGRLIIEDGVRTGTEIWLVCANHYDFYIGKNTVLGSYSIFNAGHGLGIGSDCIFA